jgi:glycosyltransferase involved in cell wall biosynthesis
MTSLPPDVPVVVLGSSPWEAELPVTTHHVARRMAARGHRVLFVESTGLRSPSLARGRDLRRTARRLRDWVRGVRRAGPGLWVLAPLALPWGWPRPCRAASMSWIGRAVRRACGALGFDRPIVWAFLPTGLRVPDLLAHRLFIYHCIDHYAANPGVDRDWIDGLERAAVGRANLVFASSPVLARRLEALGGRVVELPNVADVALFARAQSEQFAEPEALRGLGRPRAVYVGNLAEHRIDFALLDAVAEALPRVQFVIAGLVGGGDTGPPGAACRRFMARTNVRHVGVQPQADLPAWLQHCQAGLIPFLDNEHTRGSMPLKLWEYAAAGLPAVATDLPNLRAAAAEGAVVVARGAAGFAAAVEQAVAEPPGRGPARLEAARRHDWPARMEEACGHLAAALGRGGQSRPPGEPI